MSQFDTIINEVLNTLTNSNNLVTGMPSITDVEKNAQQHFGILDKVAKGKYNLNDQTDKQSLENAVKIGALKAETSGNQTSYSITEPYLQYLKKDVQDLGNSLNKTQPNNPQTKPNLTV